MTEISLTFFHTLFPEIIGLEYIAVVEKKKLELQPKPKLVDYYWIRLLCESYFLLNELFIVIRDQ